MKCNPGQAHEGGLPINNKAAKLLASWQCLHETLKRDLYFCSVAGLLEVSGTYSQVKTNVVDSAD